MQYNVSCPVTCSKCWQCCRGILIYFGSIPITTVFLLMHDVVCACNGLCTFQWHTSRITRNFFCNWNVLGLDVSGYRCRCFWYFVPNVCLMRNHVLEGRLLKDCVTEE